MRLTRYEWIAAGVIVGAGVLAYLYFQWPQFGVREIGTGKATRYVVTCPDSKYECQDDARAFCDPEPMEPWNWTNTHRDGSGDQALEFFCR